MEAQAIAKVNLFSAARARFEAMTSKASCTETSRMTHADVERWIEEHGRELLCDLFQGHMDCRGPGDVDGGSVTGADGIARTHRRRRPRGLLTVVGEVEVPRTVFERPEHEGLCPRDAELNLPPTHYSHGVERRIAESAAIASFDTAVDQVAKAIGTKVPKRQAEEIVVRSAADFDGFYDARVAASKREASKTGPVLVLTFDGKGVVMRTEDLREATRKAAAERKPKLASRRCKGEKAGTKRMALVAAVYTIAMFERTPEDIVRDFAPVRDAAVQRPRPENKRVWARIAKSPRQVIADAFDEAERRDPLRTKSWVVLVDGNRSQLRLVRREARRRNVEVTIVLDVVHVREYLWKAAYVFHAEGSREAEAWVNKRMLEILRGHAGQVAGGIRRSATKRGIVADSARKPVEDCARYLLKNKRHLHYEVALAAGFPIATGVIEGACRHLIKDRLDITGARWSLAGAEAVLCLRALRSSGDLAEYWAFHEARDYQRHHASRYANGAPPKTLMPVIGRPRPALRLVA
jgi:hypothetical protein